VSLPTKVGEGRDQKISVLEATIQSSRVALQEPNQGSLQTPPCAGAAFDERREEGPLHQAVDDEVPAPAPEVPDAGAEQEGRPHGVHRVDPSHGYGHPVHQHARRQHAVDERGLQPQPRQRGRQAEVRHLYRARSPLHERNKVSGLPNAEHHGTHQHVRRQAEQDFHELPRWGPLELSSLVEEHLRWRAEVHEEILE